MTLGDGIRRNIAHVEPTERAMLREAILQLHQRHYPGLPTETPPGGVSWWFKQDEIHQATHVHGGPEFVPWHREFTNRFEQLIRQINPQLSLHYWDFADDPTNIQNGNLGAGVVGPLSLFTPDFLGAARPAAGQFDDPDLLDGAGNPIRNIDGGNPWLTAHFYDPAAGTTGHPDFRGSYDGDPNGTNNPNDLPRHMARTLTAGALSTTAAQDAIVANNATFTSFRSALENLHNSAHGYIANVSPHIAFRDPLVFLLHSNVDRLYARWQTNPAFPARLTPSVYGSEFAALNAENVEPWSTGIGDFHPIRPWESTHENQGTPHTYTDVTVVAPPCYDTNLSVFRVDDAHNPFDASTNRYQLIFNDVPETETTWRAAVVRVFSCPDTTYRVKPGTEPPPGSPFGVEIGVATAAHGAHENAYQDVRLWFRYTAGAVGTAPVIDGPLNTTIVCDETGEEFKFELRANTIARPTVAVQMVLDQSGSMAWDAGTSHRSRLLVLKESATMFADLIQDGNGLGMVRFDDVAYPPNDPTYPGMPITRMTTPADRSTATTAIAAHGAHGNTSIGAGLIMGHAQLAALPAGAYANKAMLLLTDGVETAGLVSIADAIAAGATDDRVHVIGLGNEFGVNTDKLNTLSRNNLLLSGTLTPSTDDFFRVKKFFLQILAAVTNTSIVRDPTGFINVGTRIKIPFDLNETDISCRAIVLTDLPLVDVSIETPDGTVIDPARAAAAGLTFTQDADTRTASFVAPLTLLGQNDATGTWSVVLEVDERRYRRALDLLRDKDPQGAQRLAGNGVRYCVSAHSFSNLRMTASLAQSGYRPGDQLTCRAELTEYGVPVEGRATVVAQVQHPDGTPGTLSLTDQGSGRFEASMTAGTAGVYRFTVAGSGVTFRGAPFTREQLFTVAVVDPGVTPGDPADHAGAGNGDPGHQWCDLLDCLLSENVLTPRFEEQLKKLGVDLQQARTCIEKFCAR